MRTHLAHIAINLLALWATSRSNTRQPALIRLLVVLVLLFDCAGLYAHAALAPGAFWYFYWSERTLMAVLQCAALLQLALLGAQRMLRAACVAWSAAALCICLALCVAAWRGVFAVPQHGTTLMLKLMLHSVMLCSFCAAALLLLKTRYKVAIAGLLLWAAATACSAYAGDILLYAALYPLLSALPMLAWTCLLVKGGKQKSYVTRTQTTARECKQRGHAARLRDTAAAIDVRGDRIEALSH